MKFFTWPGALSGKNSISISPKRVSMMAFWGAAAAMDDPSLVAVFTLADGLRESHQRL
jgi:hypothetical protein